MGINSSHSAGGQEKRRNVIQFGAECLFALLPLLQGGSPASFDPSELEMLENRMRMRESEKLQDGNGALTPAFAAGGGQSILEQHRAEMGTFFRNMMDTDYQGWTPADMHERFGIDLGSSKSDKYIKQTLKRVRTAIQATNAGTQQIFSLLRAGYSIESFLEVAQKYLATLEAERTLSREFAEKLQERRDIDPQKRLKFSQMIIAGLEWTRVARDAVSNHMRMLQKGERSGWIPGLEDIEGNDVVAHLHRRSEWVNEQTRHLIGGQTQNRDLGHAA